MTLQSVVCDHALYTWSRSNLGSGGGFGMLARSASWPSSAESRSRLFSFLPQGATVRGAAPPRVLSYSPAEEGVLVARKTYLGATGDGRPGNYLVHALVDPSGTLTPRDVAALASAAVPYRAVPDGTEVTDALEPLVVPRRQRRRLRVEGGVEEHLVSLVGAYLSSLSADRPVVLISSDPDLTESLLLHLYTLLPLGLTKGRSFTTYESRPVDLVHHLSVVNPAYQDGAVHYTAVLLDLDAPPAYYPDAGRHRVAAEELVGAYVEGAPLVADTVATLKDLAYHLEVQRSLDTSPDDLSQEEIARLLGSVPGWLESAANRVALLRHLDSATPRLVDKLLALRRTGGLDVLLDEATDRLASTVLDGGDARALEDVLLQLGVWPAILSASIGRHLLEVLRSGNLTPHQALRGFEHLMAVMNELHSTDFQALAALPGVEARLLNGGQWHHGHRFALEEHLTGRDRGRYGDAVYLGVRDHKATAAATLDALLSQQRIAPGDVHRLHRTLGPDLMVSLLLQTRQLPPYYLLDLLEQMQPEDCYRVLSRHWEAIARHQRMPQLAIMLRVSEAPASAASGSTLLPKPKRGIILRRRR